MRTGVRPHGDHILVRIIATTFAFLRIFCPVMLNCSMRKNPVAVARKSPYFFIAAQWQKYLSQIRCLKTLFIKCELIATKSIQYHSDDCATHAQGTETVTEERMKETAPDLPQRESEWLARMRSGDPSGFEHLFREYGQQLINFARRYVADTPIAENLVQDVFLKIWENRAQLDPQLKVRTYLYSAVRNQALRHLRHKKVEDQAAAHLKESPPGQPDPHDHLSEKELAAAIQAAIAELPEKCRLIFNLSRIDRLTYTEIAEIQGISVKTVETQMGRALKFLRKRLHPFLMILPL